MTEEQRAVETAVNARVVASAEAYLDEYERRFGSLISVDNAAELFEEYNQSAEARALHRKSVHHAAQRIADFAFRRALKQGGDAPVVFTAGGTGAGKSSSVSAPTLRSGGVVYDSTLSNFAGAVGQIEQALAAGRPVEVLYTWRDPVEAFRAVLGRAMDPTEGNGRVIDVRTHVATHRNAAAVIVRLAERFAGDPRVVFHYFRNSGRPGLADRSTIAVAETARYDGIESRLLEVLEDEYQNGRISEAVYRAGLGNRGAGPGESEAVRRPTGSSGEGSSGAGSEADARSGQGEEDDPLKRREPLFSRRPPQGGKFATREERIAFDREQQESMFGVEAEVSEEERANHAKLERDRFTAQFNELATLGLGPPRPQRRTPRR